MLSGHWSDPSGIDPLFSCCQDDTAHPHDQRLAIPVVATVFHPNDMVNLGRRDGWPPLQTPSTERFFGQNQRPKRLPAPPIVDSPTRADLSAHQLETLGACSAGRKPTRVYKPCTVSGVSMPSLTVVAPPRASDPATRPPVLVPGPLALGVYLYSIVNGRSVGSVDCRGTSSAKVPGVRHPWRRRSSRATPSAPGSWGGPCPPRSQRRPCGPGGGSGRVRGPR